MTEEDKGKVRHYVKDVRTYITDSSCFLGR